MVVNVKKMTAEIKLGEDALYIVKDGHLTKVSAKQFGNDSVTWREGKVWDIDRTDKVRINGQEVI